MIRLQHKYLLYNIYSSFVTILCFQININNLHADQIDLTFGMYEINAQTSTDEVRISNFGKANLRLNISSSQHLSYTLGYSIYSLGIKNSDLGYGINMGFIYFPFNFSGIKQINRSNIYLKSYDPIRFSVGMTFNQRQFQSIHSNYAGVGCEINIEYQISALVSIY